MPEKGFFELYPAMRPILPAGSYLLAADHELRATPLNNGPGDLTVDGTDFTLKIISPRYTMPPNQILSTFPPASAVGDWRQRLPQIVFKRRTMPWERDPDSVTPFFVTDPHRRPPWLALVVLAEGEGTLSGDVPIGECVTAGTPMADDNDTSIGKYLEVRQSIVDTIFPTVADLQLQAHVRKVNLDDTELALGDDDGYLSVIVSNRLPQPGPEIAQPPSVDPAAPKVFASRRYTAFLINVEGQLHGLPTDEVSAPTFDWLRTDLVLTEVAVAVPQQPVDVITMHGLAQLTNAITHANGPHSVAPHGLGPQVATVASSTERSRSKGTETAAAAFATGPVRHVASSADDNDAANRFVTGTALSDLGNLIAVFEATLRFPVLASWDFVCTGEGTFESIMNDLDTGMLGTFPTTMLPELRPTVAETGHILLEHTTRRGELAEAWYRSPFVPQPTARVLPDPGDGSLPVAHSGDQLRRVVPDGHEDLSLAAAFEIGRLLALSKPGVVAALMRWRQELFGAARVRQLSVELMDSLIAGFADAAVLKTSALEDLLADRITTSYTTRLVEEVPRAADFTSSRRPDAIARINAKTFLDGLGLDLEEVTSRVRSTGLSGLAAIDVRTAPVERPLSGSKDADALRSLLSVHIEAVAEQATVRRRNDVLDRTIAVANTVPAFADPRAEGDL